MKMLCLMQEMLRMTNEYEVKFQQEYQICLNEGLVLCLLESGRLTSGAIAAKLSLSTSNTSKVVCSLNTKGLVERCIGEVDKRQMYFTLSDAGLKKLNDIRKKKLTPPENLEDIAQKMLKMAVRKS